MKVLSQFGLLVIVMLIDVVLIFFAAYIIMDSIRLFQIEPLITVQRSVIIWALLLLRMLSFKTSKKAENDKKDFEAQLTDTVTSIVVRVIILLLSWAVFHVVHLLV